MPRSPTDDGLHADHLAGHVPEVGLVKHMPAVALERVSIALQQIMETLLDGRRKTTEQRWVRPEPGKPDELVAYQLSCSSSRRTGVPEVWERHGQCGLTIDEESWPCPEDQTHQTARDDKMPPRHLSRRLELQQ